MRQIILASGSPRRQELVSKMGFDFSSVPSNFDERLDDSREAEVVAKELALGKALDVAKQHPEALVIGSDNVVTFQGRQLGKQPDAQTAKELLRQMSGKEVGVLCSVALVCQATGLQEVAVCSGSAVYKLYDDAVIDAFLTSNDWQDKAGAQAIQSPLAPPVAYIQGDYDAILGISTRLLADMLRRQGVDAKEYHPVAPVPHKELA